MSGRSAQSVASHGSVIPLGSPRFFLSFFQGPVTEQPKSTRFACHAPCTLPVRPNTLVARVPGNYGSHLQRRDPPFCQSVRSARQPGRSSSARSCCDSGRSWQLFGTDPGVRREAFGGLGVGKWPASSSLDVVHSGKKKERLRSPYGVLGFHPTEKEVRCRIRFPIGFHVGM